MRNLPFRRVRFSFVVRVAMLQKGKENVPMPGSMFIEAVVCARGG